MNGLADLGWALLSLCLAGCFLAIIAADHAEITRRFSQAARLLSEAGPWLAAWLARKIRGEFAAPSHAHPAARALTCSCEACTADLDPVAFARWEHEVRSGWSS